MALLKSVLVIGILLILMAVIGHNDKADRQRAGNVYCEMVTDYKLSGGAQGWPDYDNNYATRCN